MIPFRTDDYGPGICYETAEGQTVLPIRPGETVSRDGLSARLTQHPIPEGLALTIHLWADRPLTLQRLGFRLGIDCYMDTYPAWNEKFFPTALRCEKKGFWSSFRSPLGKMISVCAPNGVVSWRNEYNRTPDGDVGHRIYTSTVDFLNRYPQPARHPLSPAALTPEGMEITLYYGCPADEVAMEDFVARYAGLTIPHAERYTLEPGQTAMVDGRELAQPLHDGVNTVTAPGQAELTLYVRRDWMTYLDAARRSAERCQQKPGTHCESWYGYFSRVQHATICRDESETQRLCQEFDRFFEEMTLRDNGKCRFKPEAAPWRLQNVSSMLSLLADFYELTGDRKYLDDGNDLSESLLADQAEDGSYRCHGTHYTCVIYPAKSMLEFALAEKKAGETARYRRHYDSAFRAIENLAVLMDNIQTEGEMTFEDGMISCESLQLGYLATLLPEGPERRRFAEAAETILRKHRCLEQQILPDCRVRGCTTRYWEARYDLNFFANMLNSPHGWTSWKTYATYYLYLLTGKLSYLRDTMDTLGACMQCVDAQGVLHWGYVADPWVKGHCLSRETRPGHIRFTETVVGETYLPMISDWYREPEGAMPLQYLSSATDETHWAEEYGGSCDNDVHEHFKCLTETVFGKAFVHLAGGCPVLYNCRSGEDGFVCTDPHLTTWVVRSEAEGTLTLNGRAYPVHPGIQEIPV